MPFTECYCQSGASNLNAGSTTANAAAQTYVSAVVANGWNAATGVFTVAAGNPVTDGVAVGDFASVYVTAGATVATFIGRITARDATTITVSLTAVSGTPPATDATGATSLKVGGAWAGPSGAVAFPFNFVAAAMTNSAGDTPRVNLKNNATYAITAGLTHTLAGPVAFQGYTTTAGDLGKATIDGGTAGASYVLLTVSGATVELVDMIFGNNGATGSAAGLSTVGTTVVRRVVVHDVRGGGFGGNAALYTECEAYACNQSATANTGGFTPTSGADFIRCKAHDNVGATTHGYSLNANAAFKFTDCTADTNGGDGFFASANTGRITAHGCDAYNNGRDGCRLANATDAVQYIENSNFIRNAGWGINGQGAGGRIGAVVNCGFGAGTQANTSGTTTGLKGMTEAGSVVYPTDATPYAAPATGDFRIVLPAAQGAGRGAFTQTQASYTGTVGYPDIGAGQHRDDGSRAIPSIGRAGVG